MGALRESASRHWHDWCARRLHPALSRDADTRRRAELLLAATLLLMPLALVRSAVFFAVGAGLQSWLTLATFVLLGALLAALRRIGSLTLAGNLFMIALAIPAANMVIVRGGFFSPLLVALAFFPLFATFLAGWRSGLLWTVVVAGTVCTFAGLDRAGVHFVDQFAGAAGFRIRLVGLLFLPFAIFGLALAFELTKNAALGAARRAEAERARAEADAQVMRAERLASMGQLVAAVAHEINNPLTYVLCSLEEVEEALGSAESVDRAALLSELDRAKVGLSRIHSIVRDLRTFTRPAERTEATVALRQTVQASLRIVENELRHKARVLLEIDESILLRANESHLGQLSLNLLLNAAHALEAGSPEHDRVSIRAERTPGGDVVLEIEDTGSGMSEQVREHAFDPFFTTKPVGVGTGLGLSVCLNIMRAMGGELTLESELGKGTIARAKFPAERVLTQVEKRDPASTTEPPPSGEPPRHDILLVDDDELVARAVARVLKPHRVVIASSGEAALGMLAERHFDVIVCDLMMPGLSGADVHRTIASRHRGLEQKIVFLSGGALGDQVREFADSVPNKLLQKPVVRAELQHAVAEAAARKPNASGSG